MGKLRSGILASMAIALLQAATGTTAPTPPPAVQAASHLGGIWAGKASILSGFRTWVEVPARGLIAADGMGYFLIRNTVLHAQLRPIGVSQYEHLDAARVVGTAPDSDIHIYSSRSYYIGGTIREQALNLSWCYVAVPYPDDCGSMKNRLALNYDRSYESGSSLAKISGHYVDTLGQYKGVLTIASDGNVFMQDPATGCVVNGRVAMINRAYNMYSIKLAYANCRSATLKGASFTGLVSYGGPTRHLFALMLGTAGGVAAANKLEFRRQ